MVVQHQKVCISARLQGANAVFQAQRACAAQCRQIQRLERVKAQPLQLHDFVGFVQGVEQRETGARAYVGAQADVKFVFFGHWQVEQAAAQKQV